ncbi:MAG: DNA repair protein RecN [bacterium]
MLEYLRIQNLAIIEDVELELGPGLCVITGETGAGKSIVVGALSGLRGARLTRESVRDGAEGAVLEALLHRGVGQGGAVEAGGESTVVLHRVVTAAGRSRQRIDGELVPLRQLVETVGPLLDISGQHDGQTLMDPSTHLGLLDAAGVSPKALGAVRTAVERLAELSARLQQLSLDERERASRLDLLSYQLEELEAVGPEPGESERLRAERRRLASAVELEQLTRQAGAMLYEDEGSVVDDLGRSSRLVSEAAALDEDLAGLSERLDAARAECDDVARELLRYAESIEGDPARLDAVEGRLDELDRLRRKHGVDVDALAELRERLAVEVEDLRHADERIQSLRVEIQQAREAARDGAKALTAARRRAANRLSKEVEANLQRLGMAEARFLVRLEARPARKGDDPELLFDGRRLSPLGWDRVELFVAPNPGEEPMPLARTASGGELSRLMLAIKLVLADRDRVQTYVFDEVDAGIGGVTADTVGFALAKVARHRQVICITHLPAIAAFADQHFRVTKRSQGGRTRASIARLSEPERTEELARMLGGARLTKATRAAAAELLTTAAKRCKML